MKRKLILIIAMLAIIFSATAQVDVGSKYANKQVRESSVVLGKTLSSTKEPTQAPSLQTRADLPVLFSDDFATSANWTSDGKWVIGTTAPTGTYSASMGAINSTTKANGFAKLDADLLAVAGASPLTLASPIDCSAATYVSLSFQTYYRKFDDKIFVRVSDNNSTWIAFELYPDLAENGFTDNPANVVLDISSVAAGKSTVWIQLYYTGYVTSYDYGYAWMVDDLTVYNGELISPPTAKVMSYGGLWSGTAVNDSVYLTKNEAHTYVSVVTNQTSADWTFDASANIISSNATQTLVSYNTPGKKTATLDVVGNDESTISKEVTFFAASPWGRTDYVGNLLPDDALSIYSNSTNNYTFGFNTTNKITAEIYVIPDNETVTVNSIVLFPFYYQLSTANRNVQFPITFRHYNPATGTVGDVIQTYTPTFATVFGTTNINAPATIPSKQWNLTTPVTITGSFVITYSFANITGNPSSTSRLGLVSATGRTVADYATAYNFNATSLALTSPVTGGSSLYSYIGVTYGAQPDETSPELVSVTPIATALLPLENGTITVTFDENIVENPDLSIDRVKFGTPNFFGTVSAPGVYTINDNVLTVTYDGPLDQSVNYKLIIANEAFQDAAGNKTALIERVWKSDFVAGNATIGTVTASNGSTNLDLLVDPTDVPLANLTGSLSFVFSQVMTIVPGVDVTISDGAKTVTVLNGFMSMAPTPDGPKTYVVDISSFPWAYSTTYTINFPEGALVDGHGDPNAARIITFSTEADPVSGDCDEVSTAYAEDFTSYATGAIPTGWVAVGTGTKWNVNAGKQLYCPYHANNVKNTITTDEIDLSSAPTCSKLYFSHAELAYQGRGDTLAVYYQIGEGSPVLLGTYCNLSSSLQAASLALPLAAFVSNFRLVFEQRASDALGTYVDNILIGVQLDYDIEMMPLLQPTYSEGIDLKKVPFQMAFKLNGSESFTTNDTTRIYISIDDAIISSKYLAANLAPGSYSLAADTINFSGNYGTFVVKAWMTSTKDPLHANDTVTKIIINNPLACGVPTYTNTFTNADDIAGALIVNANDDTKTWALNTSNGGVLRYAWSSVVADDWFISKCIELTAGKEYKVSFDYKGQSSTFTESLDVYYGTEQSVAGMTTQLVTLPSIVNQTLATSESSFTASTTGSYYIGFHCYSIADQYNLDIDNLKIEEVSALDAQVVAITEPSTGVNLTDAETVKVSLKNNGASAITSVGLTLEVDGIIVGTETVGGLNIAALATEVITLTNPADVSSEGSHVIRVWVDLAGDATSANDTAVKTIVNTVCLPVTILPWEENLMLLLQQLLSLTIAGQEILRQFSIFHVSSGHLVTNDSYGTATVTLPPFNLASQSETPVFKFDYIIGQYNNNSDSLTIYYKIGDGGALNVLKEFKPFPSEVPTGSDATAYEGTLEIPLNGYADNYYIVIQNVGAYSYSTQLDNFVVYVSTTPVEPALMFTEYTEGASGNNKALELTNTSDEEIDLTGYVLKLSYNGTGFDASVAANPTREYALSGTLAAKGIYVIYNDGSAAEYVAQITDNNPAKTDAIAYATSQIVSFNGNDAVGLFLNGELIDIIGEELDVNDNPLLKDVDIRRLAIITTGNTTFTPTEWAVHEWDDWSNLGVATNDETAILPNNDASGISLYANDNVVTILSTKDVKQVEVYDVQGRIVLTTTSKVFNLDNNGLFLIRVKTSNEVATFKVSK